MSKKKHKSSQLVVSSEKKVADLIVYLDDMNTGHFTNLCPHIQGSITEITNDEAERRGYEQSIQNCQRCLNLAQELSNEVFLRYFQIADAKILASLIWSFERKRIDTSSRKIKPEIKPKLLK